MGDINEELHNGEKIEKMLGVQPIAYLGIYIVGAILCLTIFGAIIGIPLIVVSEFNRRGNTYYITSKRVIHQFTFLSRKTSSALYGKIQDIYFTQNLIERMFGIGKVHINTAGTNVIEIIFKGIQDPVNVKRMIEEHMIQK